MKKKHQEMNKRMKWYKFEKEISFRRFIIDRRNKRVIPYTSNKTIRIRGTLCID